MNKIKKFLNRGSVVDGIFLFFTFGCIVTILLVGEPVQTEISIGWLFMLIAWLVITVYRVRQK